MCYCNTSPPPHVATHSNKHTLPLRGVKLPGLAHAHKGQAETSPPPNHYGSAPLVRSAAAASLSSSPCDSCPPPFTCIFRALALPDAEDVVAST